jgi:hypothetical protein
MRIFLHAHAGVGSVKKIILARRWARAAGWGCVHDKFGFGKPTIIVKLF